MKVFTYDHMVGDETNYQRWRLMNEDEREEAGEAPLPEEEARVLFEQLKESGWLMKSV